MAWDCDHEANAAKEIYQLAREEHRATLPPEIFPMDHHVVGKLGAVDFATPRARLRRKTEGFYECHIT